MSQGFVSVCLGGSLTYFWLVFLVFGMLGTSYTRRGLLREEIFSRNVDGGYAMCESLPDDKASCDTNLQFPFVVPKLLR